MTMRAQGNAILRYLVLQAATVLVLPLALRADVTLNGNSVVTGGVNLASTPAISTNGTGTGSAANPWVYAFAPNAGTFIMGANQLTSANGNSFKLDLYHMDVTGTSGKTNFLAGGPAGNMTPDTARGSVTLVNAGDISIGAIATRVTAGGVITKGGSITVGSASGGVVGNVRVDSLNSSATGAYSTDSGSVGIYSTGHVTIATSGGTAGNIDSSSATASAGALNVQHNGSFLAYDILTYYGGYNWGGNAASADFNGALGGAALGSFTAHTIDASARRIDGQDGRYGGSITIQGYRDVTIASDLLAFAGGLWHDRRYTGNITITSAGNLTINGLIDAGFPNVASPTRANMGVVFLSATGTIALASLDLNRMSTATLSASNATYIAGNLLNFPTNAPGNGLLDAATNTTIYYTWNTANNLYLKNTNYTLKSGGRLVAQTVDIPLTMNAAVSGVTTNSVAMNGTLVVTGQTPVTVSVYWGTSNGGNNAAAWGNTNAFAEGQWNQGDSLFTNIATLASDQTYYYTYYGAAAGGGAWAANGVVSFITGELTVQATDPSARANGGDTGMLTVYRPAGCTNEDLAVNYVLGGAATLGADYSISPASGSVVIPKGQTSGVITVTPIYKLDTEKTVILTLTNGAYPLVSATPATVTLAAVSPVVTDVILTNTTTVTGRVSLASTPTVYASASTGAGTAASPWFYPFSPFTNGTFIMGANRLRTANGDSFKLDLDGMAITGTSGVTNIMTGLQANNGRTDNRAGSVTLVNAGDIAMGGVSTHLASGANQRCQAGSITFGVSSASVGNVQADALDSGSDFGYCDYGSGAIAIYGRGNVLIQNSGGTPGNLRSAAELGPAGSITVQHNGSFVANDILSYKGLGGYDSPAGNVTFNGAVGGGTPSGSFQVRLIDASYKLAYNWGFGGNVTIQGYQDVTIASNLLTYAAGSWDGDRPGHITITASGNIRIGGLIDASEPYFSTNAARANLGVVSLAATGTITLASLDLRKMNTAMFAAGQGATIEGGLLNFPTNTPANGWLDAPTNRFVYYNPDKAGNGYLAGATYGFKSGGLLKGRSARGTVLMVE